MQMRNGFRRVDTDALKRRAATDPAVPLGQSEPPANWGDRARGAAHRAARWVTRQLGWILLVVFVVAIAGAALTIHFRTYPPDLVLQPGRAVL